MALHHALVMAWETFWALVLGFFVSALLQNFVSKEQMGRLFGRADLRSIGLATVFGAASSSCSYAAAAAGRSAVRQGAALVPALAFMFASTNLVIELGAVLWLLMGWRFVLAEFVGALVLIGLLWLFARLLFPRDLEEDARRHAAAATPADGGCGHDHRGDDAAGSDAVEGDDHCGHHHPHDHGSRAGAAGAGRWRRVADSFVMDWQMLWKEITVGFLIAGFLMAFVPDDWWKDLFLANGPAGLRLVENAVVGPLIAAASFVCSVGNIPLASLLWSGGISFGGVLSFIYADLLIVPLVLIYGKYYGARAAAWITGVLFLSVVGAGIIVDLLFGVLGLIPQGPRPESAVAHAHFAWNYTTWLDLLALAGSGALLALRLRRRPPEGPGKTPAACCLPG